MAGLWHKIRTTFQVVGGIREARQILAREAEQEVKQNARPGATLPGPKSGHPPAPPSVPEPSAPGAQVTHNTLAHVHGPLGYGKELLNRFNGDFCSAWAAALSFFAILSFVPILVCGIAVLGFVIQDPQIAAEKIQVLVQNIIPGSNDASAARQIIADAHIEQQAESLIRNRGIAGLIGIVSLFWAASRIFVNASTPMNAAFRTKETRNFLQMQISAIGLMFGAGLLFLLSLLPASGPALLRQLPFLSHLPDPSPWYMDILFFVLGVAINAAMFAVIYKYLPSPSARVSWRQAGFAGTFVAILWEAAKRGFAIYLEHFGSKGYDKVYGSLGGLIILILWVYYSSMILLLGAEIAKLYQDYKEQKGQQV